MSPTTTYFPFKFFDCNNLSKNWFSKSRPKINDEELSKEDETLRSEDQDLTISSEKSAVPIKVELAEFEKRHFPELPEFEKKPWVDFTEEDNEAFLNKLFNAIEGGTSVKEPVAKTEIPKNNEKAIFPELSEFLEIKCWADNTEEDNEAFLDALFFAVEGRVTVANAENSADHQKSLFPELPEFLEHKSWADTTNKENEAFLDAVYYAVEGVKYVKQMVPKTQDSWITVTSKHRSKKSIMGAKTNNKRALALKYARTTKKQYLNVITEERYEDHYGQRW